MSRSSNVLGGLGMDRVMLAKFLLAKGLKIPRRFGTCNLQLDLDFVRQRRAFSALRSFLLAFFAAATQFPFLIVQPFETYGSGHRPSN